MDSKKDDTKETWLAIILGVLAIVLVKSLFENDDSKIVSKKGQKMLSDEEKMKEVNDKISKSEEGDKHQEIFV